jgi:hypothetical protein
MDVTIAVQPRLGASHGGREAGQHNFGGPCVSARQIKKYAEYLPIVEREGAYTVRYSSIPLPLTRSAFSLAKGNCAEQYVGC